MAKEPWREVRPTPVHIRQFAYLTRGDAGHESFRVPPWGYFEGFEAVLLEPVPCMDYAAPLEISIAANYAGQPIGQVKVHTLHRNVQVVS